MVKTRGSVLSGSIHVIQITWSLSLNLRTEPSSSSSSSSSTSITIIRNIIDNTFGLFGSYCYDLFPFSLTRNPMGTKISKRYSYKSPPTVFKPLLNFLSHGLIALGHARWNWFILKSMQISRYIWPQTCIWAISGPLISGVATDLK